MDETNNTQDPMNPTGAPVMPENPEVKPEEATPTEGTPETPSTEDAPAA